MPERVVHDFRKNKRGWGHDYTFEPSDDGVRGRAAGWKHGIKVGDILLFSNAKSPSGESPYQVTKIKYFRDPPDMWKADLEFAPRNDNGEWED